MKPPQLMAVINITPDSYYQPSRKLGVHQDEFKNYIISLETEGADIFDVGGESSRPGATPVSLEEELSRVLPIIEQLRDHTKKPISIDTMKPQVAEKALRLGVDIINDIRGLIDPDMRTLLLSYPHAKAVVMHMQNNPQNMQKAPHYPEGVVSSVYDFFARQLDLLEQEGVDRSRIILDPGIGFGKTLNDNILLMKNVGMFQRLGCELMYGVSRKLWIQALLGRPVDERLPGTLAAALFLAEQGVTVLRVHDIKEHKNLFKEMLHEKRVM